MRHIFNLLFLVLALNAYAQFADPTYLTNDWGVPVPQTVFVEDMDFDGDQDIIAMEISFYANSEIHYFENLGDLVFEEPIVCYYVPFDFSFFLSSRAEFMFVDINNDNFKELIYYDSNLVPYWLDILSSDYSNWGYLVDFELFSGSYLNMEYPDHTQFVDFDSDGDLDFVFRQYDFIQDEIDLGWLINDGNWNFTSFQEVNTPNENFDLSFSFLSDLDSDGDIDGITQGYSFVSVIENNNNTSFQQGNSLDIYNVYDAVDMDGDGDLDLLGSGSYELLWCENLGNLDFSIVHPIFDFSGGYIINVLINDFNSDLAPDLLFSYGQNFEFPELLMLNDGLGNFVSVESDLLPFNHQPLSYMAEIDGDGLPDIVSFNNTYIDNGPLITVLKEVETDYAGEISVVQFNSKPFGKIDGSFVNGEAILVISNSDYSYDQNTYQIDYSNEFILDANGNARLTGFFSVESNIIYRASEYLDADHFGLNEVATIKAYDDFEHMVFSISTYNYLNDQYDNLVTMDLPPESFTKPFVADLNGDDFDDVLIPLANQPIGSPDVYVYLSDGFGG